MMSLFLNALLAFWGNGIESQQAEVWFYHPLDGTYKYNECKISGDWKLDTESLNIKELAVRCDKGPGWLFEQNLKNLNFERDADVLNLNGNPVGFLLPGKNGFDVEFTDKWDAEHRVKLVSRTDGSWRMEWFVSSNDYVSFDMLVNEQ